MKAIEFITLKNLFEAATKNIHSAHLEQLVLLQGYDGVKNALTHVNNILNQLKGGESNRHPINVKFDGAPAIIVGTDPSDGKFFVATKGAFSKTPKIAKSAKDVRELYEGGLRQKMGIALKYLPELGIRGVIQGDMLYTSSDLFVVEDEEEKFIAFKPNTIVYAVPVKSDLAKRIKSSKMGIIFHTRYKGDSFETMQASFGIDASELQQSKHVWFDDSYYKDVTGIATFTDDEEAQIKDLMFNVVKTLDKTTKRKMNSVLEHKEIKNALEIYVNALVRADTAIGDPVDFLNNFRVWYRDRVNADIQKQFDQREEAGKTLANNSKVITSRREKGEAIQEYINKHAKTLVIIMQLYSELQQLKQPVIEKLSKIVSLKTFYKDNDGSYKVTNHEGFVSVTEHGMVKLVDRLTFSRLNFNLAKDWKK